MPTNVPMIVGPDGKPVRRAKIAAPTIGLGVDHEKKLLVLIANGTLQTKDGLIGIQVKVPLTFTKAHDFARGIQAAMLPPELAGPSSDGNGKSDG